MAPLIVQLVAWGTLWIIGAAGLAPTMAMPVEALRVAFAVMFVFTGVAHSVPRTRTDMLAMVPPTLPMPGFLVTATGTLQLAGAAGLLLPTWSRCAAFALTALLVAMFPANIHAGKAAGTIAGRPAMSLVPRLMLQLFWMAGLWVAMGSVESRAP